MTTEQSTIEETILLGPQTNGLTITKPMLVKVETCNDGTYIVGWLSVWGMGDTLQEAIDDFSDLLIDYIESLRRMEKENIHAALELHRLLDAVQLPG